MNIGIIIYSKSGNTEKVAEELKERLIAASHSAEISKIEIEGDVKPGDKNFVFIKAPEVTNYDALVFGSPVMAFSLNPVMKAYLKQINSLKNKKVSCFVTKRLPFKWTGGTMAIQTIKKLCVKKGGTVHGKGIIIWSSPDREKNIEDMVKELSISF